MTTMTPTTDNATTPAGGRESERTWPWLVACAEMAVLAGLSAANRRLMRSQPRGVRHHTNGLKSIEPWHWHTVLPTQQLRDADVDELLDGTLAVFDETAFHVDPAAASCVRVAVVTYMRTVIGAGIGFNRDHLARMIHQARCVEETAAA